MKVAVLGGGSWGTALAREVSNNNNETTLYIRNEEQFEYMKKFGVNKKYLPNVQLPENLEFVNNPLDAIENKDIILLSVPTNSVRSLLDEIKDDVSDDVIIINSAKGIEEKTLMRISEIVKEKLPNNRFVTLSGPTHAEEVALDDPTAIVAASDDLDAAACVQNIFMSETFRVYTNDDLLGVELAGALKNIIALCTGVLVGLNYGDNSKAALMTRGIAEITRLGVAMGAKSRTFLGLAGVGDLIVTCTSEHSRNRKCGKLIGEGMKVEDAVKEVGMVVEGIKTTLAAKKLSDKCGVDMPITNATYDVLYSGASVEESIRKLMTRAKKHEMEGFF
jgi:glycerol-3-phosphate dehydrogenase (NAD(P)+)